MVHHVISFRKGNRQPINNIHVQTITVKVIHSCLLFPSSFVCKGNLFVYYSGHGIANRAPIKTGCLTPLNRCKHEIVSTSTVARRVRAWLNRNSILLGPNGTLLPINTSLSLLYNTQIHASDQRCGINNFNAQCLVELLLISVTIDHYWFLLTASSILHSDCKTLWSFNSTDSRPKYDEILSFSLCAVYTNID